MVLAPKEPPVLARPGRAGEGVPGDMLNLMVRPTMLFEQE